MKTRLLHLWENLTSSYWFVPTLMAVGAVVLALALVELDRATGDGWLKDTWFIYLGGPDGARALLSTVASSVITVAGVVFSITIAALTQASSQFGPLLLRNFMRDRGNQVVLGTFVATFIYCLLVLRTVYGQEDLSFVPHIAVTVATVLAVASIGVLIYFIHHVSLSLQAPQVIARAAHELRSAIDQAYPRDDSGNGRQDWTGFAPTGQPCALMARRAGYLQAIEHGSLVEEAEKYDVVVHLRVRPGHFLTTGQLIAEAFPAERVPGDFGGAVNGKLLLGSSRSPEQDVEFGVSQLVEIAVRALSTGVNDPFTAVHCVDWLGESLAEVARRPPPSPLRRDGQKKVRLIEDRSTFEGLTDAAFNQVRQHAQDSVAVTLRLLEAIARVAASARTPEHRRVLLRHVEMIHDQACTGFREKHDLAGVEERYHAARAALQPDHV